MIFAALYNINSDHMDNILNWGFGKKKLISINDMN